MNHIVEDMLMHVGVSKLDGAPGPGSGRYPLGSGKNPFQHGGDFLSRIDELKKSGMSEKEIADALGLTTTQLRAQKALAKNEKRSQEVATARRLREEGYSLNEIAQKMGYNNDSSVRSLLNEDSERRMNQAMNLANFLKSQVDEKGMIDVGTGIERELGNKVSKEKLNQALAILEAQGYMIYGGGVPQVTNPGKQINLKVLCPPGTEHKEIYDFENIHTITDYTTDDGGDTFRPSFVYPESMDSSRLQIRYAEDGGIHKDGVVEIRRGVQDLSLGESHYAQVRILVDGTHYIKGMAVYSDDLPDGVDVMFNTNKKKGTPKMDVLKKIKDDPDNPFGSLIKNGINDPEDPTSPHNGGQSYYIGEDGKKHLSLINKRSEEGDWGDWSDHLPSQFLSKQKESLIHQQLDLTVKDKVAEYEEICSLTNPTVKKRLLQSFADDCDTAAVHLKAAALPRQKYQVILPLETIKDNEVYAPNYKNGETVALIRYPHGGTFEIPVLTVNNKQPEGRKVLGNTPKDAIGINSNVAERLSGADFDGDTVMVIPCNSPSSKVKITSTPPLDGLKGFDPKLEYGGKPEGTYKRMTKSQTQTEMGIVSNLITDMTLKGATNKELEKAVRHSMVVIDAEKHGLDYRQSEKDNDIAALKKKYQGHYDEDGKYREGASTLISKAKSEERVLKRRGQPWVNENTGELEWERTNPKTGEFESKIVTETYTDKKGKTQVRTQTSTKMAEAKDAYSLVSDFETPAERAYADYANQMKSLANQARKEMVTTGKIEYSATAKQTYQREVDHLNAQLNVALKNAPRERQAQLIANTAVSAKKQDNPDMTKAELKKAKQQELVKARTQVGAKRTPVEISDSEWEAIQAGAISENRLMQILNHTDIDKLKERATPRTKTELSTAKINKIKAMSASGYSTSEIADALGVSSSTVSKYLN